MRTRPLRGLLSQSLMGPLLAALARAPAPVHRVSLYMYACVCVWVWARVRAVSCLKTTTAKSSLRRGFWEDTVLWAAWLTMRAVFSTSTHRASLSLSRARARARPVSVFPHFSVWPSLSCVMAVCRGRHGVCMSECVMGRRGSRVISKPCSATCAPLWLSFPAVAKLWQCNYTSGCTVMHLNGELYFWKSR